MEQKLEEREERMSRGGFDRKYKGEEERGMCQRGEREEKKVEKTSRCRKGTHNVNREGDRVSNHNCLQEKWKIKERSFKSSNSSRIGWYGFLEYTHTHTHTHTHNP